MLLFFAFLPLALAVFVLGEVATAPQRRRSLALRRAAKYGARRVQTEDTLPRFRERVVGPGVERLAGLALRVNPKVSADAIGRRLIAAGLGQRISTSQFLAVKTGLAIAGLVAGAAFGAVLTPVLGLFFAPLLGVVGAISKLTEHMHGALVDEFALTLGEMRVGESRPDALKRLAERVPAPEVSAFVRSVVQAEQLGISLGRILRVQAADSRLRRQAAAEERAMKAPIKMLFPTALFIFPAMFVAILGPAFLNISTYLHFK
jgi:Type II secretion system (T2SS), protein F